MSEHTASHYSYNDERVPDVEQHIVHQSRSTAPSNSARNARPRTSRQQNDDDRRLRRLSQFVTSRGRQDDTSMDTRSLLSLASDLVQVLDRPASNEGQTDRPSQSTSRQGALARSTAAGHVGNPRTLLPDQPSRHGGSSEQLPYPSRDRVQSLPSGESLRRPTRSESTPIHANVNYRRGAVGYGHTVLAGHISEYAHAVVEDEYSYADMEELAGSMPAPISRLSSNTRPRSVQPQPEQPRSRPAATPRSSFAHVPCQADLGRTGQVLDARLSARRHAAEPADHQLDNISVHSLDIESEAQARATLAEGGESDMELTGPARPSQLISQHDYSRHRPAHCSVPSPVDHQEPDVHKTMCSPTVTRAKVRLNFSQLGEGLFRLGGL